MGEETTNRERSGPLRRLRGLLKNHRKLSRRSLKKGSSKGSLGSSSKSLTADSRSVVSGLTIETTNTADANPQEDNASKNENTTKLKVVLLLVDPKTRRFELVQLKFDPSTALVSHVLDQIKDCVTDQGLRNQTYSVVSNIAGDGMAADHLLSDHCSGNEVVVAVPEGLPSKECARVARIILNHKDVLTMLIARGIDIKDWRMHDQVMIEEEPLEKTSRATALPEMSQADRSLSRIPEEKPEARSRPFVVVVVLMGAVLLLALLGYAHVMVQAPIHPGQVLAPGTWRSKCGFLTFLPGCDNAFVFLDHHGHLSMYDSDYELNWQIKGSVCDTAECLPGLVVKEDSTLVLGGQQVGSALLFKESSELSPWPFGEKPEIKIFRNVHPLAAPKAALKKLEHLVVHREREEKQHS